MHSVTAAQNKYMKRVADTQTHSQTKEKAITRPSEIYLYVNIILL